MPRDTLTREQIVTAAIDLLDAEGLDGLNMRALGQRLGSAPTAVYWHVGSKDNLMALAADQAVATVFTFVLGNALGSAAVASLTRKLSRDGGNADELMHEHMAKAREIAAQFPRLRSRLGTATADYGAAPGNTFEFGLHTILDGLEAQLTTRRPARTRKPPATAKDHSAARG